MTLRVALEITGDGSGSRREIEKTKAELGSLTKAAETSSARTAALITKMETDLGKAAAAAVQPMRLNQHQLMNMQFQLNDMATMLASGQSPFVMLMQQGMQIGQIFGPGATVSQALKATGAGIFAFLTNPINLAIAATAVAAGAIPAIWHAFTGPEAASAEDMLDRLNDMLGELAKSDREAANAIRRQLSGLETGEVLVADFKATEAELRAGLAKAIDELALKTIYFKGELSGWESDSVKQLRTQIEAMGRDLVDGKLTVSQFREQVAAIRLDPETPEKIIRLVDNLRDASGEARKLEAGLRGASEAIEALAGHGTLITIDLELKSRLDPEGAGSLADKLAAQAQKITAEAERRAREAQREAEEAARLADQRETNRITVDDLQREVEALSATGVERERLLGQLRDEQEIRQAIAGLGPQATEAEIEALTRLIPIRNELNEQARESARTMREEERSAKSFGNAVASLTSQLMNGANAGEVLMQALQRLFLNSLSQSATSLAGSTGLSSLLSVFGFSDGGWTGPGGKHQPKGVVHGDEFVFSAAATRRAGVANLDALHRSLKGYAEGGYVGPPVAASTAGSALRQRLDIHLIGEEGALFKPMVREISGDTAGVVVTQASPRIVGEAVRQSNANVMPTIGRYQREVAGGDYRL